MHTHSCIISHAKIFLYSYYRYCLQKESTHFALWLLPLSRQYCSMKGSLETTLSHVFEFYNIQEQIILKED